MCQHTEEVMWHMVQAQAAVDHGWMTYVLHMFIVQLCCELFTDSYTVYLPSTMQLDINEQLTMIPKWFQPRYNNWFYVGTVRISQGGFRDNRFPASWSCVQACERRNLMSTVVVWNHAVKVFVKGVCYLQLCYSASLLTEWWQLEAMESYSNCMEGRHACRCWRHTHVQGLYSLLTHRVVCCPCYISIIIIIITFIIIMMSTDHAVNWQL